MTPITHLLAPTPSDLESWLREAQSVARQALADGHHPFGAVLIGPDGRTVLLRQGNVSAVEHAEAVLARTAARQFDAATLWQCTLVTTVGTYSAPRY